MIKLFLLVVLESCRQALEPLAQFTVMLSGESYVSSSSVLLLLSHIIDVCASNIEHSVLANDIKEKVLNVLPKEVYPRSLPKKCTQEVYPRKSTQEMFYPRKSLIHGSAFECYWNGKIWGQNASVSFISVQYPNQLSQQNLKLTVIVILSGMHSMMTKNRTKTLHCCKHLSKHCY